MIFLWRSSLPSLLCALAVCEIEGREVDGVEPQGGGEVPPWLKPRMRRSVASWPTFGTGMCFRLSSQMSLVNVNQAYSPFPQ